MASHSSEVDSTHFETLQLHAGQPLDKATRSRAVPIYQTVYFNFDSCEHAARLFAMQEDGYIGTRTGNPTIEVLEKRVAALEGGLGAIATASGQNAVFLTMVALSRSGDNIVSTAHLYHGAYNQFRFLLPDFGISARIVSETPDEIEKAIDDHTKAVYIETIGHPDCNVPDIRAIADVANKHRIPLVVENTAGFGGYLCRPIAHGADIVVHSTSKWIGGHGTAVGGIIVDAGSFDWSSPKFPVYNEPCPGYHGVNFFEVYGRQAFLMRVRGQLLRDIGPSLSPFNAQQLLLGLETLSLRAERHVQNATAMAQWLRRHPKIEWVSYLGLPDHPHYHTAQEYLPRGAGAILTFGVRGGAKGGEQLMDGLHLISTVAGYGDSKSCALHPWSTTHKVMEDQEKLDSGVTPGLIRLSVGIEHVEDLKADFQQSMEASPAIAAAS